MSGMPRCRNFKLVLMPLIRCRDLFGDLALMMPLATRPIEALSRGQPQHTPASNTSGVFGQVGEGQRSKTAVPDKEAAVQ